MRLTPIQDQAEKILNRRWGRPGFDALFREEQEVLALYWLEVEVLNGGFHQYFCNSAGDLAPLAVSGLKRIDAPVALGLLETAMANLCAGEYPTDRDSRWDALSALGEEPDVFDDVGDRFREQREPFREMALERLAQSYGLLAGAPGTDMVMTSDGKVIVADLAFFEPSSRK